MAEESLSTLQRMRGMLARALGVSHGGARDLYGTFGYPVSVTTQDLLRMYLRNDIASRIIRAFPQATWRDIPVIRDEKGDSSQEKRTNGTPNPSFSPFVLAVEDFFEKHRVMQYLERADRLAGIGRYGVLLMGFRDGAPLNQPLADGKAELIYLAAYHEDNAKVSQWDKNPKSPRYGMPVMYQLNSSSSVAGQSVAAGTVLVHYTRVLHLAEHLDENEVMGTPRLLPVYNRMLDLEKVVGSSAETFWLNSRGGLALMADKDVQFDADVLKDMKEQAADWEHQLRRVIAMQGVNAQMLQHQIADPKPNVETLLQLIGGSVGIPVRILIGSERGELSSTQDENNWAARIDERQNQYASPGVLKPFIAKMIATGNLPEPQGIWWVEWPDSASASPVTLAQVADTKAATLQKYVMSPGADLIVPIQEFRTDFLGLTPESEYDMAEEDDLDETDEEVIEQMPDNPYLLSPPVVNRTMAEIRGIKKNAAPRTLYVHRRLLNAEEVRSHFAAQGITPMVPAEEMHVTIAYSKKPVDWFKVADNWYSVSNPEGTLTVPPGGVRMMERFGAQKDVLVLLFASSDLSWRNRDIIEAGASWDWPDYQPHITISYEYQFADDRGPLQQDASLATIVPYQGALEFGPEIFEELDEDWKAGLKENVDGEGSH